MAENVGISSECLEPARKHPQHLCQMRKIQLQIVLLEQWGNKFGQ